MKRLSFLTLVGIISLTFGLMSQTASAGVNDFSFSNFEADYYLSKDNEGRSSLRVVEQLTAEFPTFNQNKGIERAIPSVYNGHSVSFKLVSLKRNGLSEPIYEQRNENNNVVVATGTDDYVTGTQVYEFTYTLRDVTKDVDSHQEFYWDTNGDGWSQRFDNVVARVHLDESVSGVFDGEIVCFQGGYGASADCQSSQIDGSTVTFTANGALGANENMTFAMKFAGGTFAARKWGLTDAIPYVLAIMSLVFLVAQVVNRVKYGRNHPGRGTIVPEYLPPDGISVVVSSNLYGSSVAAKTTAAQIIDLAVRHHIRIIETEKDAFFGKKKVYTLELLSLEGLDSDEVRFIDALFGSTEPNVKKEMTENDRTMAAMITANVSIIAKAMKSKGYRYDRKPQLIQFFVLSTLGIGLAVVGIMIVGALMSDARALVPLYVLAATNGVTMMVGFATLNPLTESGRAVKDYLKGLKTYIGLAEVDRLRVLQSPQGADKTSVNSDDKQQVVKLYERVLPYAVLFGQEKEWAKQLTVYYQDTQTTPGWYMGNGAFNAAIFASSISSFTSYSAPASSSGSGFGGGGFSGGGGGGGGGGGR